MSPVLRQLLMRGSIPPAFRLHHLKCLQTCIAAPLQRSKLEGNQSSVFWSIARYIHTTHNSSFPKTEENPRRYCPGGYCPVQLGDKFNGKYQIISKLGYGVYSTVWLAKDLTSQPPRHVALKILTADSYGTSQPVYKLDILKHISRTDPSHPGSKHVVHLLNDFVHESQNGNHLCLVLELMGQSIFSVQQRLPNKQLQVKIGREVVKQTLYALDWLHDSCGVIHTDIKPDNILLEVSDINEAVENHLVKLEQRKVSQSEDPGLISQPIVDESVFDSSQLKFRITDFGVASWKDNHLTDWIQPPSLRAPEVFLGAPWDSSVDIWSLACVVYELFQGRVLFRGRPGPNDCWTSEEDQLAQMIELFGPIPESVRKKGKLSNRYFSEDGDLLHIKQTYPYALRDLLAQTKNASMSAKKYELFETFLLAMLQYEPRKRKTPKELLGEPWLSNETT